ncbi:hypothetical protein HMPREF0080_01873 [Anaeroglobus geminatus F0357]|uniref:Uncharacterized protein n=1 Tax=Anaeroglobus geminatus F0357 TaxID=861450 RepID=G9YJM0_9FIRM|nr:hypothetical protein HMPREF0080_01873 [Anaeroglobus geminatus F0357]
MISNLRALIVFFVPPCRLYLKIIEGMKRVNDVKLPMSFLWGRFFASGLIGLGIYLTFMPLARVFHVAVQAGDRAGIMFSL